MDHNLKEKDDLVNWGYYENQLSISLESSENEEKFFVVLNNTITKKFFILPFNPPQFFYWIGGECVESKEIHKAINKNK